MKALQFFESRSKQGKINLDDDFKKKLETLPADFEIPDVWINLFDQEFLTRDRAQADPKVYDTIRGEVLDGVKLNIKEYLPHLLPEDQEAINKEPKAFNQLKMLKDALPKAIEKVKTENPSNDEKVKELQKVNKEYVEKLSAQKTEFENKEKELKQTFEAEKKGMKLDWTLDKKLGEYTFADEFKEVRPYLTKSVIDKVKSENVLILDDATGQIQVHEKLESGATKQKFNGNDAVTLEKLLEEPLSKFLKKNNGAGGAAAHNNGSGNNGSGRQTDPPKPKHVSEMTLTEYNRYMASQ